MAAWNSETAEIVEIVPVSVRLPAPMLADLRRIAGSGDGNLSNVVREALGAFIRARKSKAAAGKR